MTELFTKSKMQSFECTRKVNVTQLIDSIAQNLPNSIDPSEKALTLTYSIIYHIAFSRNYEEMEGGKLKELNEEAMQILGMISTVDILPWLGGIVDAIRDFHGGLKNVVIDLIHYSKGCLMNILIQPGRS